MTSAPGPLPDARRTEQRVQTVCLLVLAVIATGAALHWLSSVLVPFALALFLAIALSPVVDQIAVRTKLSRGMAVGVTMVLGALLLLVLGGFVAGSLGDLAADSATYEQKLEGLRTRGVEWLTARGLMEPATGNVDGAAGDPFSGLGGAARSLVGSLVGVLGTLVSQGLTVLVFLMFLLVEQRRSTGGVAGQVDARVKRYIAVKIATSAVTGIAVGLALTVIGVDAALLFGLLTFLLNFIPTIGSIIAVLLPLPVVLAGDLGVAQQVLAFAVPGAIQFAVGQIWENRKLGAEFDLRASVVLLALVFWGKVWGLVGMLLATPMTAVLKTLMEDWDLTRPLARSMGAGPAKEEPRP